MNQVAHLNEVLWCSFLIDLSFEKQEKKTIFLKCVIDPKSPTNISLQRKPNNKKAGVVRKRDLRRALSDEQFILFYAKNVFHVVFYLGQFHRPEFTLLELVVESHLSFSRFVSFCLLLTFEIHWDWQGFSKSSITLSEMSTKMPALSLWILLSSCNIGFFEMTEKRVAIFLNCLKIPHVHLPPLFTKQFFNEIFKLVCNSVRYLSIFSLPCICVHIYFGSLVRHLYFGFHFKFITFLWKSNQFVSFKRLFLNRQTAALLLVTEII